MVRTIHAPIGGIADIAEGSQGAKGSDSLLPIGSVRGKESDPLLGVARTRMKLSRNRLGHGGRDALGRS